MEVKFARGRKVEGMRLFPKDMLNPVGTGSNDRTGQLVG